MNIESMNTREPLWERACSRWRQPIRHNRQLTHRFREQARSHRRSVASIRSENTREPLWEPSLLAMAVARPTSPQADSPPSRAGSLAHKNQPSPLTPAYPPNEAFVTKVR
ncbi:hypothetical protein EPZ47_15995 [Pseudomonas viciae]|uniref:Uncharacterized protein n=1 Tax=Pseudomonas viciae TaxID=2505979 RepID=A0A4P7PHG3_9PSED|nr:hypothetical protein EPZ47_15995 [Pseudomonas viciae]